MNKFMMRALAVAAAISAMAVAPSTVQAQEIIRGVYSNKVSVKAFIHNVERESNSFRAVFEKRYHDMFVSNFRHTDASRKAVQDLDKAVEKVYRRSQHEKTRYIRDDVATAVKRGRELDRMMSNPDRVLATMDSDWEDLKAAINAMADMYDLPNV